ncbi:MAG TPA: hypothetical protein VJW76_01980 [Verrucomicrobiae bacterium]|nr:hypothetical protein [Verrucomicrobiae bacterium]
MTSSKLKIAVLTALAAGIFSALAQQTNTVNPKDFEAFKIIVDRNIFDVNRRPPVARGTPRPPPAIVDTFVLTGTMSYESGLFAVFDGSSSEYHKVLRPGGKIASYTLAEITHDFVKLSSGTNELELRVGMQMRRSEDGKWSVGERGEISFASNSDSRSRNSGRGDRNDRRSGFSPTRNSFRNAPDQARENPTTDAATLDPNDVIARLIANRNRETGGNANQDDNERTGENPDAAEGAQNTESDGLGENPGQRPNDPNETRGPGGNPREPQRD